MTAMYNSHVRSGLLILSRGMRYGVRLNSIKPPKYVESRPPPDPPTKIPDTRIVPLDHAEPAGPFPSTLLSIDTTPSLWTWCVPCCKT